MSSGVKIFIGAAICVAALVVIFVGGKGEHELSFGAILPITGGSEHVGRAEEAGLMIAEKNIARFFKKENLHVLVRDSEVSPDVGAARAEELVAEENVDALFSSMSVVTAGVSEVARTNEVPMFYDSCNCGFAEANPYAFQLFLDPRKECREIANIFLAASSAIGPSVTAAYVGQDVPYANFCIDAMKEQGVSVIVEKDVEGIQRPYEALFSSWASQGVSFVVSIPPSSHIVKILEANEMSGARIPLYCAASQCLTDEIVSQLSPDILKNVRTFDFDVREVFVAELQLQIGKKIVSRDEIVGAAVAHDALVYAATAAVRCADVNTECILEHATRPIVPLAIESDGFDEGRILKYTTEYISHGE